MKAKQRINVNGKRFVAGGDLTGLSAEELALIPSDVIEGASDRAQASTPAHPPISFKPIGNLNKAEMTALATSINVEVGEHDTKATIGAKIDARIASLPAEVKDQLRDNLIESLAAHFDGDASAPSFAAMRDEELKVLLARIMFVNLGAE